MFSFFGLNKITTTIFIAIVVFGVLSTTYFVWKSNIENQALLQYNSQQLQQTLEDQQKYIQQQREIENSADNITEQLIKRNNDIIKQSSNVDDYLNSKIAKENDDEVSQIIIETIEILRKKTND